MHRRAVRFFLVPLAGWLCVAGSVRGAPPAAEPPQFQLPAPAAGQPLTFVVYGDTRFTARHGVANATARRALVARIAQEQPAAIFIGGDLVYQGADPDDYDVYRSETAAWTAAKIPVFPALGNHEFKGCRDGAPCLENWWNAFEALPLRGHRWYSVMLGPALLALVLDSDSALRPASPQMTWFVREVTHAAEQVRFILVVLHYPPVGDPVYPHERDEKQIARFLSRHAGSLRARVVVVGSHVHNYERYRRKGVMYLVSGGGGARPVHAFRLFGELSRLTTAVNFHYLRFTLQDERLTVTMVRFEAADRSGDPWSEPDRFEVDARQ